MRHPARRPLLAFLASALIHLVALGLLEWLLPPTLDHGGWRPAVRRYRPLAVRRLEPTAPVPVSREMVRRVLGTESALAALPGTGAPSPGPLPETPPPPAERVQPLDIRHSRERQPDSLPDSVLWKDQVTDLPMADPVELDAQGRRRNVAVIDPATGKLARGWLHLPVYGRGRGGRAKVLGDASAFIEGGHKVPGRVPLRIATRSFHLGGKAPIIEGITKKNDLIHTFGEYPERHLLHHSERREFSVLHLGYIDVESLESLVEYLAQGGFAFLNSVQMSLCQAELARRYGDRVEQRRLELDHRLFHSYYDITRYRPGNRVCPGIRPVPALVLDGRIAATAHPPSFTADVACRANRMFVNFLAFALIQPSRMGGRYEARR